jgi:glucosamine-phosphate N-acetyltransferase
VNQLAYSIREIKPEDIVNGFLDVLSNLTEVGDLSQDDALRILDNLKRNPIYKIFVAVSKTGEVVGTTTLLVEQKFIHKGGLVAHIEDVAVKESFKNQGIGRDLIQTSVDTAKESGCYKIILDCNEQVARFYEKLGFKRMGIQLRMNL